MKTKLPQFCLCAALLGACFLTGCVDVTRYTYNDAPLTPVRFETTMAEQTFYDAILAKRYPADGPHGYVVLYVKPPIWYAHRTLKSAHVIVNEAVAAADSNHDGVITEAEAAAFAKSAGVKQVAVQREPAGTNPGPAAGTPSA